MKHTTEGEKVKGIPDQNAFTKGQQREGLW